MNPVHNIKKMRTIKAFIGILLVAAIFLSAYFFLFNPRKKSSSKRPDWVLLIIMDTVRADHLGCYGYQEAETMNIDHFTESSAMFDQAISSIPETGPAVSSILTSLYPHNHGVRVNTSSLPPEVVTLAEILKRNGFETAAFIDSFPFRRLHILQGFDYFHKRIWVRSSAEGAIEAAVREPLSWFRKKKDRKTFTLIHFYDAHMPYNPIEKSKRIQSLNYDGPYAGDYGPAMLLWTGKWTINEKDITYMASLYDDEISMVDEYIGIIIEELKKLGKEEETLVIITADHGESLGDHDYYFDHGDYLYEDQIRIPLIIRYPHMPQRGVVIDTQVRAIDIMPTILDVLDIDHKGHQDGVSLVPLLWGKRKLLGTLNAFSESDSINFGSFNNRGYIEGIKGKHVSVRRDGMKLIYVPQKPGGEFELYDLSNDHRELTNILEINPEVTERMKSILFDWLSKQKRLKTKRKELDEETKRILKSLHYIRD